MSPPLSNQHGNATVRVEKAEVLLQHCLLVFKNGATAEEFTELSSMLSKNKFTTKVSLLSTPLQCILGGPEIQPYTSPSWSVLLLTIIPYISIYLNPCCLSGCWVLCSVVTLLLSEILVH